MADGAQVLANLWDSAWAAGGGVGVGDAAGPVPETVLQALYEDVGFVPSLDLDHIAPVLQARPVPDAASLAGGRSAPKRRTAPRRGSGR